MVFVSSDKGKRSSIRIRRTTLVGFAIRRSRKKTQHFQSSLRFKAFLLRYPLDKDGSVITTKGRGAVSEDPTGENFPWHPPTFEEALGRVC